MSLAHLSDELIEQICWFLSEHDALSLSQTCVRFHEILSTSHMLLSHFNGSFQTLYPHRCCARCTFRWRRRNALEIGQRALKFKHRMWKLSKYSRGSEAAGVVLVGSANEFRHEIWRVFCAPKSQRTLCVVARFDAREERSVADTCLSYHVYVLCDTRSEPQFELLARATQRQRCKQAAREGNHDGVPLPLHHVNDKSVLCYFFKFRVYSAGVVDVLCDERADVVVFVRARSLDFWHAGVGDCLRTARWSTVDGAVEMAELCASDACVALCLRDADDGPRALLLVDVADGSVHTLDDHLMAGKPVSLHLCRSALLVLCADAHVRLYSRDDGGLALSGTLLDGDLSDTLVQAFSVSPTLFVLCAIDRAAQCFSLWHVVADGLEWRLRCVVDQRRRRIAANASVRISHDGHRLLTLTPSGRFAYLCDQDDDQDDDDQHSAAQWHVHPLRNNVVVALGADQVVRCINVNDGTVLGSRSCSAVAAACSLAVGPSSIFVWSSHHLDVLTPRAATPRAAAAAASSSSSSSSSASSSSSIEHIASLPRIGPPRHLAAPIRVLVFSIDSSNAPAALMDSRDWLSSSGLNLKPLSHRDLINAAASAPSDDIVGAAAFVGGRNDGRDPCNLHIVDTSHASSASLCSSATLLTMLATADAIVVRANVSSSSARDRASALMRCLLDGRVRGLVAELPRIYVECVVSVDSSLSSSSLAQQLMPPPHPLGIAAHSIHFAQRRAGDEYVSKLFAKLIDEIKRPVARQRKRHYCRNEPRKHSNAAGSRSWFRFLR
jgi:hypothetical protein